MNSHTRTMAACLDDAERQVVAEVRLAWAQMTVERQMIAMGKAILDWQRAKACRDQRIAMQIEDDKTLDELEQIEHETRLAARAACEAVGIEWRSLGDM